MFEESAYKNAPLAFEPNPSTITSPEKVASVPSSVNTESTYNPLASTFWIVLTVGSALNLANSFSEPNAPPYQ